MSEPVRRVHVEQLLPRNQFLVTEPVAASALRERRWVDGELGLTEEWLVFASGETSKAVVIDVVKRRAKRGVVEVTLSGPVGATLTDGVGRCTIKKRKH